MLVYQKDIICEMYFLPLKQNDFYTRLFISLCRLSYFYYIFFSFTPIQKEEKSVWLKTTTTSANTLPIFPSTKQSELGMKKDNTV